MGFFDVFKNQEEKKYLEQLLIELKDLGYGESKIQEFREEGMKIIKKEGQKNTKTSFIKSYISMFLNSKKQTIETHKKRLDSTIDRIKNEQLKEYFVELYGKELIVKQKEYKIQIEKLIYKIELGENCIDELKSIYLEYLKTFGYGDKVINEYNKILKSFNGKNLNEVVQEIRKKIHSAIDDNDKYASLFVEYIKFFEIPANIYYENYNQNLSKDLIREFLSKSAEDKKMLIEKINKKMFEAYKDERLKNTIKSMIYTEPNMTNGQKKEYFVQIKILDIYEKFKTGHLFSEIIEQIKLIDANKDWFKKNEPEKTKDIDVNKDLPKVIISKKNKDKSVIENQEKVTINSVLDKIPQNLKNKEYYIWVAKFFGLKYIPKEEINENLYLEAVKMNGLEIRNIPNDQITKEIALAALKKDGRAFSFLPSKFYNQDFYFEAVKINGDFVNYLPENERTKPLILAGIKSSGDLINYLPKEERTLELYQEAVKTWGPALYDIPLEYRTREMYLDALKTKSDVIRGLPHRFRGLVISAPKINGLAIEHIHEEHLGSERYLDAVKSNGWALQYVPETERTPEIYLEAAKNGGIWYIPEEAKTKEIWLEAVKNNGHNICSMPDEILTPEFITELFKSLGIIKEEKEIQPDPDFVEKMYYFKANFEKYKETNPELNDIDINDPNFHKLIGDTLLLVISKDFEDYKKSNIENKVVPNEKTNDLESEESNKLKEFQQLQGQTENELIQVLQTQVIYNELEQTQEDLENVKTL